MAKLISSLPVGSKVKYGKHQVSAENPQDIIWQIGGVDHYKDDLNPGVSGHITLVPAGIIDIRGFDAKEPDNSNADRRNYGNNNYKDSNLRQWLNKAGKPWFVKAHSADEPPTDAGTNNYGTGYDGRNGFLAHFTDEELAAIVPVNIRVAKNTVTDGGGSEVVKDKVFLLSNTEVGLANENSVAEGKKLPIFTNDASRIGIVTKQAEDNSGYKKSGAWYWWLRTPYAGYSHYVRYVHTLGALNYSNASYGYFGVRPALNLKSDILVSDTPNENGIYTIEWTNVISNDLQKINNTDFTWNVETIGQHTGVKSQLHIYNNEGLLLKQGVVNSGIGIQTDTIIPTASGTFKAKVKLWSDATDENWSNEITYEITVIPYILTLDKNIDIKAGESLEQIKFNAKVNNKNLKLKSMDNEKLVFEGNALNTSKVDLEIQGKNATIDKIAYVID